MIKNFSDFRYVDPFRGYLRSQSKVDGSCQKSCRILDDFLLYQIFGSGPSKNRTHVITPCLAVRRLEKLPQDILTLARKLLSLTRLILGQAT